MDSRAQTISELACDVNCEDVEWLTAGRIESSGKGLRRARRSIIKTKRAANLLQLKGMNPC
jgi:hypothetical protein